MADTADLKFAECKLMGSSPVSGTYKGRIMNEHEHHTDNYILRIREEDGELKVFAHRKEGNQEQRPLAYILGSNMLWMKKKP